jgi:carbon-monoxide dehydrogenase medium subunit
MKPAPLEYCPTRSLSEALSLYHPNAKYIAGGMTLGPMINLRLSQPDRLIDIAAIPELRAIDESLTAVRLGALIRHADIEDGRIPDPSRGLLRRAASTLAYRAVRNRGTIGGSLVHADPIAEWPVVMTALNARLHLHGRSGPREVAIADFLLGYLTTCMAEEEILTAITIPHLPPNTRIGYKKFCRKAGEFAHSIAVAILMPTTATVVLGSTATHPLYLPTVANEATHNNIAALPVAFAADIKSAGITYDSYDFHLHATMVTRAVTEALAA